MDRLFRPDHLFTCSAPGVDRFDNVMKEMMSRQIRQGLIISSDLIPGEQRALLLQHEAAVVLRVPRRVDAAQRRLAVGGESSVLLPHRPAPFGHPLSIPVEARIPFVSLLYARQHGLRGGVSTMSVAATASVAPSTATTSPSDRTRHGPAFPSFHPE